MKKKTPVYEIGQVVYVRLHKLGQVLEFKILGRTPGWYKVCYTHPSTGRVRNVKLRARKIKEWEERREMYESKLWKVLG